MDTRPLDDTPSSQQADERIRALEEANRRLLAEKERAEEANRIKDRFVSLVAHDLRSPISSIVGLLELMAEDRAAPLSPDQHAIIRDALANGHHVTRLIDEILRIGRLQTGRIVPEKCFFDGHHLAGEIIRRLEHTASRKKLTIHNTLPEGLRLYADLTLFGEVVQNLLTNAIKFTDPGGAITLFQPEGQAATLAVRDQGVGVAGWMLPKLFDLEEKTSTTGTDGEEGTGFGLPLSHDIMTAHDGRLTVTSSPGQGSTFTVHLPPVRPRLLLVDDQEMDRMVASAFLKGLQVEIDQARDGETALKRLEEQPPHLIISDISMPVMDGFQLLERIKQDPRSAGIPIIMITGDEQTETRDRAFRMGAADFTVKPLVMHDFLPRVRRHLGG